MSGLNQGQSDKFSRVYGVESNQRQLNHAEKLTNNVENFNSVKKINAQFFNIPSFFIWWYSPSRDSPRSLAAAVLLPAVCSSALDISED